MYKTHFSYFGGSGGFFALWHILLATEYNCDFRTDEEFYTPIYNLNAYNDIRGDSWPAHYNLPTSTEILDIEIQQELLANPSWQNIIDCVIADRAKPEITKDDVYKRQWAVSKDRMKWKHSEVLPNNNLTSKCSYSHKLFYQWNPTVHQLKEGNYDKKILIYTDYDTQMMLAKNKNAWIYGPGKSPVRPYSTKYNGLDVFHEVVEIAEHATHTVLLQDIVKTKGQALLDAFDTDTTILNYTHNDMWLNLHTNEEKQRLFQ